jgi:hypothetical protein
MMIQATSRASSIFTRNTVPLLVIALVTSLVVLWAANPVVTSRKLWDDLPSGYDDEYSIWDHIAQLRARTQGQERRPSWGGLSEQGAKASIYGNLRGDRKYLITATIDG